MNPQTARHLDELAQIMGFAKQYAFNNADELTPDEFIADQILRRSIQLAEGCYFLIQSGHDLSAAILQRALEERVSLLGYLNQHNQFKEFQDFSMAQECRILQHITSEPGTGQTARQAVEHRKAVIRHSIGEEPTKPQKYWTKPNQREALKSISEGHPYTNIVHIANYEIPSSAVHVRHNDMEPTQVPPQAMAAQIKSHVAATTVLALQIAGNEEALTRFMSLIARFLQDQADIDAERR